MAVNKMDIPNNRFLAPGTWVRKDGRIIVGDGEEKHTEWGVVESCRLDETIGVYDCVIAFHANTFSQPTPEIPYHLTYATAGLVEIDKADVPVMKNGVLE